MLRTWLRVVVASLLVATPALTVTSAHAAPPRAPSLVQARSSLTAPATDPATPIVGEQVRVTGTLAPAARRTVHLQRRKGTRWSTIETATTDSGGRWSVTTAFAGPATVRLFAPQVRRKAAVRGPSTRVVPVGQTLTVEAPQRARPGDLVDVVVTATPARVGRPVQLVAYSLSEGQQSVVGTMAQDASGRARFSWRPAFEYVQQDCGCVPFQLRATSPASAGAPQVRASTDFSVGALEGTAPGAVDVVGAAPNGSRPSGQAAQISADGDTVMMMAQPSGFGSSNQTTQVGLWRVDVGTGQGSALTLPSGGPALWSLVQDGFHRIIRPWNASADLDVVAYDMTRYDAEGTPCSSQYCYEDEFTDGYVVRDGTTTRLTESHTEYADGSSSWVGGPGQAGVFPAGDRVVVRDVRTTEQSSSVVAAIQRLGGAVRDLPEEVFYEMTHDPAIPVDGSFLAYSTYANGVALTDGEYGDDLVVLPTAGDPQRTVVCHDPALGGYGPPVVSADGSTLVFTGDSRNFGSLYTCDLDSGAVTWIDYLATGADVSADGRYVTYQTSRHSRVQVWRWDQTTGRTSTLADTAPVDRDENVLLSPTSLSDDGRTVAFLADNTDLLGAGESSLRSFNTFVWSAR